MMAIVIDVHLFPVVTRLGRHHHPVEPETLGHCFEHSRDSVMEDNGCGFAFRSGSFVVASMVTTDRNDLWCVLLLSAAVACELWSVDSVGGAVVPLVSQVQC